MKQRLTLIQRRLDLGYPRRLLLLPLQNPGVGSSSHSSSTSVPRRSTTALVLVCRAVSRPEPSREVGRSGRKDVSERVPVHRRDLLVVSVVDDGARVGRVHLPVDERSAKVAGGKGVVVDGVPGEGWNG